MTKRLINFRGTNDFARVEGKSKQPPPPTPGKGIIWSSCNTTFGGKAKGGFIQVGRLKKQKISTGFGESKQRQDLREFGTSLFSMGLALTGTIISSPIGVPLALTGIAFASYASQIQNVTFSKPCHAPHQTPNGYHEQTFEEFQQEQADKTYIATATRTEKP